MSLRSDKLSWAIMAMLLLSAGAAAVFVLAPQLKPQATLRLGDGVFSTNIVNQAQGIVRPLSESRYLQENQALLVVHPGDDKWPISTKNLEYSFDVVWLDQNRKVVYIVKNIHSDGVSATEYKPKDSARYTLELPVGSVAKKAIAIGSQATFDEEGRLGLN